jgi:hypothetical protein
MKQPINETIGGYNRPTKLTAYIEWLQSKLEEIPETSRNDAYVDIEAYSSYGDFEVSYQIRYERPETDEEYELRKRMEEIKRDKQREKDLMLLEELKSKYEPKPDDKNLSL